MQPLGIVLRLCCKGLQACPPLLSVKLNLAKESFALAEAPPLAGRAQSSWAEQRDMEGDRWVRKFADIASFGPFGCGLLTHSMQRGIVRNGKCF